MQELAFKHIFITGPLDGSSVFIDISKYCLKLNVVEMKSVVFSFDAVHSVLTALVLVLYRHTVTAEIFNVGQSKFAGILLHNEARNGFF